jgi:hypothetical protein
VLLSKPYLCIYLHALWGLLGAIHSGNIITVGLSCLQLKRKSKIGRATWTNTLLQIGYLQALYGQSCVKSAPSMQSVLWIFHCAPEPPKVHSYMYCDANNSLSPP